MNPIPSVLAVCVLAFGAPALAQAADTKIDALIKRYVEAFNRGDAATLAREVYANADEAKLAGLFETLRAESFGKLDVYDFKACAAAGDKASVQMNYARIHTFGGKMNEDESKVFDLVKTQDGWRFSSEADVAFGAELVC